MLNLFIWYLVGVAGAFATYYAAYLDRDEWAKKGITWGEVVFCLVCAVLGPVTLGVAAVGFFVLLFNFLEAAWDGKMEWSQRQVFPLRKKHGQEDSEGP